jgi:hypothetical protein
MKSWKSKDIAVYYEVHRDLSNIEKILEVLKFHKFNGVLELKSFGNVQDIPILEGVLKRDYDKDFDIFSIYKTNKNFLIHHFDFEEVPDILYYQQEPVWVNLESINMNLYELFRKLGNISLTGFLKIENRITHKKHFIFLYLGDVVAGKMDNHLTPSVIIDIINELKEYPCSINTYAIPDELLVFYLSKYKYMLRLEDIKYIEDFLMPNKMYFVQSVSPSEVGFGIFDNGFTNKSQNFDKGMYYEIYEVIKLPDKLQPIDIFDYISADDKLKTLKENYEGSIIYFCPACWSVIKREDTVCPNCNFDLSEFHKMDYEYKLLLSLEHPIKEWRKNVVYTIGLKKLEEAVPYLEIMADKEQDPFVLLEIVETLGKIGTLSVIPPLRKLSEHKYVLVRNKARFVLDRVLKILER